MQKVVLIIDDEESVRSYLSALVQRSGYGVDTAGSASEALGKIGQTVYSLIIADICLPDALSVQTWTDQVTAAAKGVPVVLISGAPSEELEKLSQTGKVRAFLSKPFELAFIRNILKEILG